MARKEAAPPAQVSSAKDDRDPHKGLPRRSSKGSRKKDGQNADPSNAAPDSTATAASTQAKDTPASARRSIYVPLHSSASVESARGRDSVPRDTVPAKQPDRSRRSPREAANSGDLTADGAGQQPGAKHKRGHRLQRERVQRQGRQEDVRKGQQGGGAMPGSGLASSQVEGSLADCPVCWGACAHGDRGCPCLDHLPEALLAEVWERIGESQRHYALTLIQRFWERNGYWPPKVPQMSHVRGTRFCFSCDSLDHGDDRCPDLSGMDSYTRLCLNAAYRFGSFNGMTPGHIYTEWEEGRAPPESPPCMKCKATNHCFEACHDKTRMRQDDFLRIVSALKAGQPRKAQEIWDSVKTGQEQTGGERSGRSERTVRKAVPVEQPHAPASDGSVNPPGGNLAQSSQWDEEMPEPGTSEQQRPQEGPPSATSISLKGTSRATESSALSASMSTQGGRSKPYWHEGLAASAAAQSALGSIPPCDSHLPLGTASASAGAAAGHAGAPHQAPQTVSQQSSQPMNSGELEAKLRSAGPSRHSQRLPPMPKQTDSVPGLRSEQIQQSLAPRTMLVTPLAPSARRASSSGQPSQAGRALQQCEPGQAGASGHLSGPSSTVLQSGSVQHGDLEQPRQPGSAAEMAQLPPPLSLQDLPSLHGLQLEARIPATEQALVSIGQQWQDGQEGCAQHSTPAAGQDRGGQSDSRPSMSAQRTAGVPNTAQIEVSFQWPVQQAGQGTYNRHMPFAAGMEPQPPPAVFSYGAPAASYASQSLALGIPAAHMHSMDITGHQAYTGVPSMALHSSWLPPAPGQMPQQLPLNQQQDAPREQHHQHVEQPAPLNHLGGVLAPMWAAQMPDDRLAEHHAAGSADRWQAQHEGPSMEARRTMAPPGFPQAPQAVPRARHDMLQQLQRPEWSEQQGWACEDQANRAPRHAVHQPLSQPRDMPAMPWLPNAPASHAHPVPAPDSILPASARMQHIRPQPQQESDGGRQGSLPGSQAQEPQEQMHPVQQPGFAEALTAQWDIHSNSSSINASPARPQGRSSPAGPAGPPRRPASMPTAASAASAHPQQQPGDDSHKDIMALLLHGVHHVAQQPETLSPRRSDCPASPGLSEAPRRSLSTSPEPESEPELEPKPEEEAMAGTKGVWGKPLSTAVRAAPKPAALLESPPRPKGPAARPGPAPASGPPQAEAEAKPLLVPAAKGPPAARSAQAAGWTKVGKHSKGETGKALVTDDEKKQKLQASPSSADSADDQNLKKAIKESLKMQAAGKRKQSGKGARSSARTGADAASAGPGLQNDPGEYNCFLNVIVQCLWHCTAFRDAFLSLPRKVVKADEVLAELSTLFRGFSKLAPGSVGQRTLDPTALRLALASLDPKRFAAGEMSDAAEVLNVVTERLDLTEEGRAMAQAVLGCHIREQMRCLRCGRDTRQKSYCQYLFTASASGLREQASVMRHGDEGDQAPVAGSAVIRELEKRTTIKSCSTDEGGCGRRGPMQQSLEGQQPRAFALQLVWESLQEAGQDIRDTLELIQEGIDLGKIYSGIGAGKRHYELSIMVCYYGRHYHAFVHIDGQWRGFDDAASYVVGSWAELVHKCELGKIQPSVLFFSPA